MYLKKLEIIGFKSFAQKTVLEFLPECEIAPNTGSKTRCGITAVVGPNGSGKSNIADAIRWALGEQSMKQLRGKKSEDVIFAGSGKKARLGNATVTLFFDNTDERIPVPFVEVSVTRKLFRSGESEYFVNGARARLLDVVDLLAKTGISKDSYCVITQGMSDAVLNATPLERRGVIEDAAGVKPHQIQKERALRKLESTRENLIRVKSLVLEIEPHLKHLRRQAEKASQGKLMAEKLHEKQLSLFGFLWHNFQTERSQYSRERETLSAELLTLEKETNVLTQALAEESKRVEDAAPQESLEKTMDQTRTALNVLERELAIIEGHIEIENEKRMPREVVESIPVDLRYVRKRLEEVREDQEKLIERLGSVEDLSELQDLRELARVIQTRLYELHTEAGEGAVVRKQIITLPNKELQASAHRLEELHSKKTEGENERQKLRRMLEENEAALRTLREKIHQSRERFFQLERENRSKQHALNSAKDALNEVKVKLARVEVREEDLTAEIRTELYMKPGQLTFDGVPMDREKTEREIARLKVELETIGGIDPLVVDEYAETEKRYLFLSGESEDLERAIESAGQVARELDQKIQIEFDQTFTQINALFEKYFKIIFGGGKASLSTVKIKTRQSAEDEEVGEGDVEEDTRETDTQVGIEIFANPPGKKISHLSMLSGGERSLTSLALLFAIISHNPPPFAVLDEVEATLDEANSRRFSRVLQELSRETQFIAITHNRETMRQASLLYGVTMSEDGVSKLLSVRLDQVGQAGKIEVE